MSQNHVRCYFIPPHVQTEVMKNATGAAADKSQKTLSDAARKRRDAADTGPAEARGGPSLAPTPTGTGRRDVSISYVVAAPIWKAAYRIVSKPDGKAHLQAWAVIENATG